jgi:hypothetical protein
MMIFMVLVLMGTVSTATAEPSNELDIVCCSYHINREPGYNEFNVGVLYKRHYYHHWWLNVGAYRNSNYKTTYAAGVIYRWPVSKKLDINIYANILTGYKHDIVGHFSIGGERIVPVILPTLTYNKWLNLAAYPVDGGGMAVSFTIARW